jgi:L-lactate permease
MSLARAIMPLAATVLLLAVTRIDAMGLKALLKSDAGAASATIPGVGQAWISPAMVVGLRDIFGTDANWRIPLLFVPFILPFVVVALAAIPVLRMNLAAVRSAWAETFTRLVRPAIALAGALGLDRATVLALQSAGGAMGNMVCIHNIVAVGAVLGLSETRDAGRGPGAVASVLRLTIGPLVAYALIAAAMAGVLSIVHS